MADVYMKQGDTKPALAVTLRGNNGAPIDLTGASVGFKMEPQAGGALKVNAGATVTNATQGKVSYQWVGVDTDTVDTFIGEFTITPSGGGQQTVPSNGHIVIEIGTRVS